MRGFGTSALLVLVFVAVAGAAPPCALACSCAEPPPLAEAVADPDAALVAGRVGAAVQGGYAFAVERWFAGPNASPTFLARSGSGADCGLPLQPGDHLIAVWYRDEQGAYSASICARFARLDDPNGEALLAEAQRLFGSGSTVDPETDQPVPAPPIPPGVAPEPVAVGAVAVGIGVLAAAALVALVARRRRGDA